jgi:hypothetical protein
MSTRDYDPTRTITNNLYFIVEVKPGQWANELEMNHEAYEEILTTVRSWNENQQDIASWFCAYHNRMRLSGIEVAPERKPTFFPEHWRIV